MYQLGDAVTGIRVKLYDLMKAREVADGWLRYPAGRPRPSRTGRRTLSFQAVADGRVMFIIPTLIVAVAAFNLVSTLVMVVTDREGGHRDPAHAWRAAGSVMQIFVAVLPDSMLHPDRVGVWLLTSSN